MATDTVPAAVPGPPDPPSGTPATQAGADKPSKGFLAAMVAPVQPVGATFDITPTTGDSGLAADGDGVLDRSAPGKSSASFRDAEQAATNDPAGQKGKAQGSIWKAWWLAGAQRWAKGGGTANKRLDMRKAQAQANQIKESRTTTINKSAGLPVRNSSGAGGAGKGNAGKAGGDSRGKGPVNNSGTRPGGAGSGGSGGGRGAGGGSGSSGGTSGGGSGGGRNRDSAGNGTGTGTGNGTGNGKGAKVPASSGKGAAGPSNGRGTGTPAKDSSGTGTTKDAKPTKDAKAPKDSAGDGAGKTPAPGKGPGSSSGGSGKPGAAGKSGATGKDGKPGGSRTPSGPDTGSTPKTDTGKPNKTPDKRDPAHNTKHGNAETDTRTPLAKSRETGHKDGSAVRQVVDHVKAYTDGAIDGYRDKRDHNAKEHDRLDKAHADHKKTPSTNNPDTTQAGRPHAAIVTDQEDDGVTTDVKPLTIKNIDANTLTLGDDSTRPTIGRRELRNFKQYERKLEAKETHLQKIADACRQLEKEANDEAKDCQDLLEQAKSIEGGEKLLAKLNKLAEAAQNQAIEAAELTQRAKRAAEMCKVVLTNIQTRYAPLYKAVVDSDETKPAELRFYNDKGSYAPAA